MTNIADICLIIYLNIAVYIDFYIGLLFYLGLFLGNIRGDSI